MSVTVVEKKKHLKSSLINNTYLISFNLYTNRNVKTTVCELCAGAISSQTAANRSGEGMNTLLLVKK